MLKGIITDWHGVIDKKTFEKFVALVAKETNQEFSQCKERIKEVAASWIRGEIDPDMFWKKMRPLFNLKNRQVERVKKYVLSIDLDEQVVDFFEKTKDTYRLALLSDCPKDKVEIIKKSKVAGLFRAMSFSCDTHISKEDPKTFLDILGALQLPPDACLYIDDQRKHVDMASSLGLQTCLFENVNDIVLALKSASIV